MAKILPSVLRSLNDVYAFEGSQVTTDQMDLSGVQLIHDVSLAAARGTPFGIGERGLGFGDITFLNAHGAGGTIETIEASYGPYTVANQLWRSPLPEGIELWVVDANVWISNNGIMTAAYLMSEPAANSVVVGTQPGIQLLYSTAAQLTVTGLTSPFGTLPNFVIQRPIRLYRDSNLTFRSIATGAGNIVGSVTVVAAASGSFVGF